MLALLRDLNRELGLTIVLITHEMDVVRSVCDRVAVLERGPVVETGAVDDIFADGAPPRDAAHARGGGGMTGLFANIDWPEIGHACVDTLAMLRRIAVADDRVRPAAGRAALPHRRARAARRTASATPCSALIVNVLRSVPFIILLIVMIPLTVALVGTSLGVAGAIPPLVVGAAPFFARLVESALREVDRTTIEATQAMGATTRQIVTGALMPEALPGLIAGATVTAVALVSFTAMAGVVGAGGLGDLAIRFGYQRFQTDVMVVTVVLLVAARPDHPICAAIALARHFTRR